MKYERLLCLVALPLFFGCSGGEGDDGAIDGRDAGTPANDSGTTPPAGSGAVVYSDLFGLYRISDGETTELGTGAEYRALTRLMLSSDGTRLLHTVGRDIRVTSMADGSEVLARQAGHVGYGWIDDTTIIAGAPGAGLGTIGSIVRISMDGTSAMALDVAGKEYCTAGADALSPDGTKIIMRCGFGNDGELVLGDLVAGTVSGHGDTKITESGTPPMWLANDHVVHINDGGDVQVDTAAFDAPMVFGPASSILRAGPNAVLAIATDTGQGGVKINTFTKIDIPSGATTDMAWLAEPNPTFEKVLFSADGSRVLFADGNGIFAADVDGANLAQLKEKKEGRLAVPLQSITW